MKKFVLYNLLISFIANRIDIFAINVSYPLNFNTFIRWSSSFLYTYTFFSLYSISKLNFTNRFNILLTLSQKLGIIFFPNKLSTKQLFIISINLFFINNFFSIGIHSSFNCIKYSFLCFNVSIVVII